MAIAQQPQQPAAAPLVEAKKEVVVNWTLGDQLWDFKQVLAVYEPIKGALIPEKQLAVWTLQLAKDMQPGEVGLHAETQGTVFRPVMLNAEKLVLATDTKVQVTPISGRMGDTLQMIVQLPDAQTLTQVKTIRIERRTNVGF
jgi:hypothetical protein